MDWAFCSLAITKGLDSRSDYAKSCSSHCEDNEKCLIGRPSPRIRLPKVDMCRRHVEDVDRKSSSVSNTMDILETFSFTTWSATRLHVYNL